jgi:hypothetical protein
VQDVASSRSSACIAEELRRVSPVEKELNVCRGEKEDGGDRRKRARSGPQGRVTAMHVCVPVEHEYVLAFMSTGKVGAGRKEGMAKLQPVGDGRP